MKIGKILVEIICFFILIVLNIICNGVSVLKHLNYENTFHVEDVKGITVTELDSIARKHDVIIFARMEKQETFQNYKITYYTSEDNTEAVQKHIGLSNGYVRNIIEFNFIIEFKSFKELNEINVANCVENWGTIGNEENVISYIKELKSLDGYSIKFAPKKVNIIMFIPLAFAVLSFILLLFLTRMGVAVKKKEVLIRAINGDSPWHYYLSYSLIDTFSVILIWIMFSVMEVRYTQVINQFSYLFIFPIIYIFCMWIINLQLIKINPKEIVYGVQHSNRIIRLLSVISVLTSVITCITIQIIVTSMPSIKKYKKAERFFLNNGRYMFIQFQYDNVYNQDLNESKLESYKKERVSFFKDTDNIFNPICIAEISRSALTNGIDDKTEAIYCNHRALSYIKEAVPEANNINLDKYDEVLLIPNSFSKTDEEASVKYLKTQFHRIEGYEPEESKVKIISYEPKSQILCFEYRNTFHFIYHEAPVICVASDTYQKSYANELTMNHDMVAHGTLFCVRNVKELEKIFSNYSFSPIASNAYEKFKMDYRLQEALFIISIMLICLSELFYISVIKEILHIDYQINAIELALKKVLGYSVSQKNIRYFKLAFISCICDILISILCCIISKGTHLIYGVYISILLLGINLLLVFFLVRLIEKQRIVKILKGGAI